MNTLRLIPAIILVSLALLTGCQEPASSGSTTAIATEMSIPSLRSIPAQPTSAIAPSTTLEKGPEPTFDRGPTPAPVRDVSWLLDVLRSSQVMTITAMDAPEIQVPVDETIRRRLVEAVDGHTEADVMSTERQTLYQPYPQYQVLIETPFRQTNITWEGPGQLRLAWPKGAEEWEFWARFTQDDDTLWKTLEEIAPAPEYGPENIRYLFYASELTSQWEGNKYTYDRALILRIVRGLAWGIPMIEPVPTEEPKVVLNFTVDNRLHDVKVWSNKIAYGGRIYQRDDVFLSLQSVLSWGTKKPSADEPSLPTPEPTLVRTLVTP